MKMENWPFFCTIPGIVVLISYMHGWASFGLDKCQNHICFIANFYPSVECCFFFYLFSVNWSIVYTCIADVSSDFTVFLIIFIDHYLFSFLRQPPVYCCLFPSFLNYTSLGIYRLPSFLRIVPFWLLFHKLMSRFFVVWLHLGPE